jgi:AraC family transcriptional regulator
VECDANLLLHSQEKPVAIVDKALWVMERNSEQALTLPSIAAACGVSRSHLANAFGTASGWPVMKYLKARRLSEAARRLAAGAPDILAVALEAGYGSHEAFTRAFRDQFGRTPEEVRRRAGLDDLALVTPLELRTGRVHVPLPELREMGRRRLVGLSAPCSYRESIYIPAQWQRFMADHYFDIPRRTKQMPIGVCTVPDEDGCFRYVCAAEVEAFEDRRPALTYLEIEPGPTAVFAHNDHVSTIFDTYTAIWNEALPALARRVADGPVLEFHNDTFDPDTGLGGLQICIPLEKG